MGSLISMVLFLVLCHFVRFKWILLTIFWPVIWAFIGTWLLPYLWEILDFSYVGMDEILNGPTHKIYMGFFMSHLLLTIAFYFPYLYNMMEFREVKTGRIIYKYGQKFTEVRNVTGNKKKALIIAGMWSTVFINMIVGFAAGLWK